MAIKFGTLYKSTLYILECHVEKNANLCEQCLYEQFRAIIVQYFQETNQMLINPGSITETYCQNYPQA